MNKPPPGRIKLAVAVADTAAPPSAFVVWRGFNSALPKAADCGYEGVELALRRPEDVDAEALNSLLQSTGLEVSAISTGQVFATDGLSLVHPRPEIRTAALASLAGLVRLAANFGRTVNIGRVRGQAAAVGGLKAARPMLTEALQKLADIAGPLGVDLIIEPVNRYEVDFLHTLNQAAELLSGVGRPNVALMADVFHMNIEEAHIGQSLKQAALWLRYLHLADSNRLAPGWGHLDLDEVFAALKQINYCGDRKSVV